MSMQSSCPGQEGICRIMDFLPQKPFLAKTPLGKPKEPGMALSQQHFSL